ncbi:MAG: methyltransferase domain-containing protein [Kiloniellales bacterium]
MVIGESPAPDEQALIERFSRRYRLGQSGIMLQIERRVCGCDYGGTSWTTRHEALEAGKELELRPGKRLLEVGAGSGWPGLYLAGKTGCDVALIDLPFEGLKIAAQRAAADGLAGACWAAVADGAALPLEGGCFDAVLHSDVLCCLEEKLSVLRECRRVLRAGGKMVFTVISICPNLSPADYARAAACGPPFIETAVEYPEMLRQAGWKITNHVDLTPDYGGSVGQFLREEETHAEELRDLFGDADYLETLARRRRTHSAIQEGLIRREMFGAI